MDTKNISGEPYATDDELRKLWEESEEGVERNWEAIERKTAYRMMRRFLAILTAPYGENMDGYLEFRAIDLTGDRTPLVYWLRLDHYAEPGRELHMTKALYQWAFDCDKDKRDIFVGVLPRMGQNGKAASVIRAGFFWADLDFKMEGRDAVFAAIASYKDQPDMLVSTGGGIHAYYRLTKTLDFSERPQTRFVQMLTGFQQSVMPGCDQTSDVARILRLPGFHNHKPGRDGALVSLIPTKKQSIQCQ